MVTKSRSVTLESQIAAALGWLTLLATLVGAGTLRAECCLIQC